MPLRPLLLLAAIAALLLGVTLLTERPPQDLVTGEHLTAVMPAALAEKAQRLTLAQGNASLTLERHGDGWRLPATNQTASNATVTALLHTLTSLRGEPRPGAPEAFGLGEGALRLTVTDEGGVDHALEIGRMDFRVAFVRRPGESQATAVGGELFGALGGGRALEPMFWAERP